MIRSIVEWSKAKSLSFQKKKKRRWEMPEEAYVTKIVKLGNDMFATEQFWTLAHTYRICVIYIYIYILRNRVSYIFWHGFDACIGREVQGHDIVRAIAGNIANDET